mgnify:FL=1
MSVGSYQFGGAGDLRLEGNKGSNNDTDVSAIPGALQNYKLSQVKDVGMGQLSHNNVNSGAPVSSPLQKDENHISNTPVSDLEIDPLAYRTISYPKDITDNMENGHYMIFYVNVQNKTKYKYDAGNGVTVGGKVENVKKEKVYDVVAGKTMTTFKYVTKYTYTDIASDKLEEVNYSKGLIEKGGTGNINRSNEIHLKPNKSDRMGGVGSVFNTTTRITDSVALYLPPNVQDTTSAKYEGMQTGIVGLVAAGAGAFLNSMGNNDYEAASRSLLSGIKAITEEATKRAGGELVDALADVQGTADLANKAFGQATNPYMEVIFDNMDLRTFTYNFTFSPRNEDETNDVKRIIQLFRFHMAPELKGAQKRFLTLPSTFDIHYMYQHSPNVANENNFYTKIFTCVLQGVDTNYTPAGVRSFDNGAPTQITMNLSFMETELLTKGKINAGY